MACGLKKGDGDCRDGDEYPAIEWWSLEAGLRGDLQMIMPGDLRTHAKRGWRRPLQGLPGETGSAGQEGRHRPGGQELTCSQCARPQGWLTHGYWGGDSQPRPPRLPFQMKSSSNPEIFTCISTSFLPHFQDQGQFNSPSLLPPVRPPRHTLWSNSVIMSAAQLKQSKYFNSTKKKIKNKNGVTDPFSEPPLK